MCEGQFNFLSTHIVITKEDKCLLCKFICHCLVNHKGGSLIPWAITLTINTKGGEEFRCDISINL